MLRLPLVGGLQRCSRISLFCLHPHRTPQGFVIIIIIIIIDIIITVIIIIILSPLSLVSSRWSFENLYQWQRVQVNGWQVCGTMDLTRLVFLIINCGPGLSSVVSGCHRLSLEWSSVVVSYHWCSSVVIGCYWLSLVFIIAGHWC